MGITGQFYFTECTLCRVNVPKEYHNFFCCHDLFVLRRHSAHYLKSKVIGRSEHATPCDMSRKKPPVPKAQRKLWSLESMEAALRDVEDGSRGLREAARTYNVPVETLRRRALGHVGLECRSGPSTVLTHDEEQTLMEYCVKMSEMGFGLGREDVMRMAFQIVEKSGRSHPFKDGMAGRSWMDGFMKRFPRLTLRTPHALSFARAKACTDEAIKGFFEKVGGLYARLNLLSKPMQIYNSDETGINVVHKPGRIITEMGKKKVWAVTSGEKGKTHTVVSCVSATGQVIPPMMIYPRVRMSEALKKDAVPGTLFACSKSGWINQELYLEWFRFFISIIPATRLVLLIQDGHSSHISLEVIRLAQENDIHLLCLPSHTSHLLQPLDVGVFKSLKTYFHKACKQFMAANPGVVVRSENLASLLAVAWPQSMTPINIMSGFRKCGLYPLNPGSIDDRQTAPSRAVCASPETPTSTSPGIASSTDSTPESGLTTISPTSLSCGGGASSLSDGASSLSDLLVFPRPQDQQHEFFHQGIKPRCCMYSIWQKTLPFNETERNGTGRLMKRNGPFTIRSSSVQGPCVFAVRFESVLIKYYYIRTALSALAHGSL